MFNDEKLTSISEFSLPSIATSLGFSFARGIILMDSTNNFTFLLVTIGGLSSGFIWKL